MINYSNGGKEKLEVIQPLFKKLCEHHLETSTYFSKEFEKDQFNERKKAILEKENVQIILANDKDISVGYLVASVHDNQGEIESLYIDENYRGYAIGDTMMTSALKWIKEKEPKTIKVSVAYGNQVLSFYGKYGFYPRSIILKDIENIS